MSLAAELSGHIPYLRRYARSVMGSQSSGDNYVAALLEAVVSDPTPLKQAEDLRSGLYRMFVKLWSSIDINLRDQSDSDVSEQGARNLHAISPLPRQAFLLTSVEGFSREEAAYVLDVDTPALDALIEQAGQDIAQQVATNVLIIEDEPLIAMDIQAMVEELGHSVMGIARTHTEATEMVSREEPGIVLADIQLADGSSGLDAVNEILQKMTVPVIFITAFPERLLTGERPEPAFLVTKPFEPSSVSALISQALFFREEVKDAA
ncbi:response regulator [Oricola cellulosilytica]|uniref:Response regulator n=1 Tax=Oricola cellulosilytica TaxID=1429082 RepID=A0A4R0PEA0_9HYPH|nr:response regulator [Oricola cellulosilytica]TCD15083.1 response regulator [Oricola cellulosilytica]